MKNEKDYIKKARKLLGKEEKKYSDEQILLVLKEGKFPEIMFEHLSKNIQDND